MFFAVQRFKTEEYKEGRSLLERCDKLLNSIAEMTATTTELQQPSPVSVLDSSFYKDESCSPSPVMKRCVDYKGQSHIIIHIISHIIYIMIYCNFRS